MTHYTCYVPKPLLNKAVMRCTDGAAAYRVIAKHARGPHRPVNITAASGISSIYHIQNINAYYNRFKRWMVKFHGVASRSLESYQAWDCMIDRLGQNITPTVCFFTSLGRTRQFQQLIPT